MQVTQAFINAIEDKIAPSRLNSYRQYFSCQNDAEALGVYLWNKALAAAYLPLLQAIEVTLRNSIHSAAKVSFSGNSEWFLMRSFPEAKKEAQRYYQNFLGAPIIPRPNSDTVVSQLTFGFWVNTLNSNFDDPVHNKKLWPRLIPVAFPNARGIHATRKALQQRFKFIKDFRNRVGHHEPLWKIKNTIDGGGNITRHGPTNPSESIIRLNEHTDLMLEALEWLSISRSDFIKNTGYIEHLRAICTLEALEYYQNKITHTINPADLHRVILSKLTQTGTISGFYKIRVPVSTNQIQDITFDIRQFRIPSLSQPILPTPAPISFWKITQKRPHSIRKRK